MSPKLREGILLVDIQASQLCPNPESLTHKQIQVGVFQSTMLSRCWLFLGFMCFKLSSDTFTLVCHAFILFEFSRLKHSGAFILCQLCLVSGLHKLWQRGWEKWRENEKIKRKWRENEEIERAWGMERDSLSTFPHSLYIFSFSFHFLPFYPFPISKFVAFCRKMLNRAILLRVSQKT